MHKCGLNSQAQLYLYPVQGRAGFGNITAKIRGTLLEKHQEEPCLLFSPVIAAERHLRTCQDPKISALLDPELLLIQPELIPSLCERPCQQNGMKDCEW